jgi:hypothetical protein
METSSLPHKHPFLDTDKWPKIDKEINDSDKDFLLVDDFQKNIFEKFELNAEHKQWVMDGCDFKKY